MDFSLWPAAGRTWQGVLEGAEYAERTGWHGVWIADHFMQNGDDLSVPVNEVMALIAGVVARTSGFGSARWCSGTRTGIRPW